MAEILAPIPGLSVVHEILDAGADRLYTGLRHLSREGVRTAPDRDELVAFIMRYPELADAIHVAINIVPSPGMEKEIFSTVEALIASGLRNFIVNEHGLLRVIGQRFPEARLCGSVGLSAVNPLDALFLEELGARAMVLPILASPDDLREIKNVSSISVEVFVICRGEPLLQGKCMLAGYLLARGSGRGEPSALSSKKTGLCFTACRNILGDVPDHDITAALAEWARAGADTFKIEGRYRKVDEITAMVGKVREALLQTEI